MEDVGYVLLMIAFVVLAALFTIGCDKIIGPDEAALADQDRGGSGEDVDQPEREQVRI
jgi:hypothetical protein